MSRIKNKNTKPEVYLRKLLFAKGYRYRIAPKYVPGHPDIYLKKYNTAIFIHGCFWHRHINCKYAYTPKSRVEFWGKKFSSNTQRDKLVTESLLQEGIKQLVVWECTVKRMMKNAGESDILSHIEKYMLQEETRFLKL